jgi:hypothetical protein
MDSEVRLHLEHANRHAPSKDIAEKYAICEVLRFMADGGIWKDHGADDNRVIFVEYILPNTEVVSKSCLSHSLKSPLIIVYIECPCSQSRTSDRR